MEPWELEIMRRSTVMLTRGQQAAVSREQLLELIGELERLQARERRARDLAVGLRALLEGFDASPS